MTCEEAISFIHSLKRPHSRPGLHRICRLMERLGNPEKALSFIHVAGTNGKGSCTVLTAEALRLAGYRTGMYTSPYIIDFRERFQINGEWIPEAELARLTERIRPVILTLEEEGFPITEFECNTALALLWFAEQHCEIVVLETGIGGRQDATNCIPCPLAAVITSLSLDHTALLGDTLEEIAAEKAGIIKGGTVILAPEQQPEAVAAIMERCAETGATLRFPNLSSVEVLESGLNGSLFRWGGQEYCVGLCGQHQIKNAVTVLETLRAVSDRFPVSLCEQRRALADTRFPARVEILSEKPLVILDGSHNPQGTAVLADLLQTVPNHPKIGVIGMLADKDWQQSVRTLAGCFDTVFVLPVENPRSARPEELAAAASGACSDIRCADDPEMALREAFHLAGTEGSVCAAGSLYLAGSLRPLFLKLIDR